jgi:hypothetical protein
MTPIVKTLLRHYTSEVFVIHGEDLEAIKAKME